MCRQAADLRDCGRMFRLCVTLTRDSLDLFLIFVQHVAVWKSVTDGDTKYHSESCKLN